MGIASRLAPCRRFALLLYNRGPSRSVGEAAALKIAAFVPIPRHRNYRGVPVPRARIL
jgi:hypothetical protein